MSGYGICPTCNNAVIRRERRINGNDRCSNGHVFPSKNTVPHTAELLPIVCEKDDPLIESKLQPYTVRPYDNASYHVFKGPLWAALEYVKAATPSNGSGNHYVLVPVEVKP